MQSEKQLKFFLGRWDSHAAVAQFEQNDMNFALKAQTSHKS